MSARLDTPRPPGDDLTKAGERKKPLWEKLLRNPYVVIAALLHLILFLVFGGKVLFPGGKGPKGDFESAGVADAPPAAQPPPPAPVTPPTETPPVPTQTTPLPSDPISALTNDPSSFVVPPSISVPNLAAAPSQVQAPQAPQLPKTNNFSQRAAAIRATTAAWGLDGKSGPEGKGQNTRAKFTCYVAKTSTIDPATYHDVQDGKIVRGPLINLLVMINAWSGNRIQAQVTPTPIDLSTDEIFKTKPPFVYFAGFSDFVLTEKEIATLRRYLIEGGAVWGDSGLAGHGSRFDIAFRREMKRVIPDPDKQFEPIPLDHPIFKGRDAFYQLDAVPPGMNYRNDDIEMLQIDDTIAILYTPNDYTDMMTIAFKPPIKPPGGGNRPDNPEHNVRGDKKGIVSSRQTYMAGIQWNPLFEPFRNWNIDASEKSFQLGTNIVVHLLTRFQEKLNAL